MAAADLRLFEGAVAVVTGGASGIGRALSEELARRGASVVLADLQSEEASAVADALRAAGRSASASALDVTDFARVKRLIERVAEEHGRLDFVFNNAGIGVGLTACGLLYAAVPVPARLLARRAFLLARQPSVSSMVTASAVKERPLSPTAVRRLIRCRSRA